MPTRLATAVVLANALPHLNAQDFAARGEITRPGDFARSVFATDLDNDGDTDLLWSAGFGPPQMGWYENLGNGAFGAQKVVVFGTDFDPGFDSRLVHAGDMDGDGLPDIIGGFRLGFGLAWFRNRGDGSFGSPIAIEVGGFEFSDQVHASDLDGDGDLDLLRASPFSPYFFWDENIGGGAFTTYRPIAGMLPQSSFAEAHAADLDGDGDMDALTLASGVFTWFENQGSGSFGSARAVPLPTSHKPTVVPCDVNGDGHPDLLSSSLLDGTVAWYENLGAGNFGSQQMVATSIDGPRSAAGVDLDADGDLDVLVGSSDRVVWFENQGGGTFLAERILAVDASRTLLTPDIDGDGDADVLAADGSGAFWYENVPEDCNGNGIPDDVELASGAEADCDSNGQPDSCQLSRDPTTDTNQNGVLDRCEVVGTNYCGPSVTNSTGNSAIITALGSELLFFSDVTLTARGLPQNSFGMFIASQTQGFAFPIPSSQGALCVLGLVGRYNQPGQITGSGATGSLVFPIDVMAIPTPSGFTQALPGETWNFQAWYRDNNPASTSNFTDAVSLTFQ